ncbi:MAG: response regulator [Prolixibacteraceae bacterium]
MSPCVAGSGFNKIYVSFLIIFFIAVNSEAKENQIFHSLTVNDGLSQHDVTDVVQDCFGFIWIATYDGLNRFDGNRTEVFRHSTSNIESLSGNRVLCMYPDSRKKLWIGTDGDGINYYSLINDRIIRVKTPNNFKIITAFAESKKNQCIYVATTNGLLRIKDGDDPHVELLQLPVTGLNIFDMVIQNDSLFLATNHGIWTYNGKDCNPANQIEKDDYRQITVDSHQNLWISTTTNLFCYVKRNGTYMKTAIPLPDAGKIRCLHSSKDGLMYVATTKQGVSIFDVNTKIKINQLVANLFDERSLKTNFTTSLYIDNQNILWTGTNQGIFYSSLYPSKFSFFSFDSIRSASLQVGYVFIGNDYLYLSRSLKEGECYSLPISTSTNVKAKLPVEIMDIKNIDGLNYVASAFGLFVQGASNSHFYQPYNLGLIHDPNRSIIFRCITTDRFGNNYFGTSLGLIIQKKNKQADWIDYWHLNTDFLRNKSVFSVLYDKLDNCVWIGTITSGLFRLNLDAKGEMLSFQQYNISMIDQYFIPVNQIWKIFKSSDNSIWLGTDAGLLRKIQGNDYFTQIQSEEVLDKKILSIEEDDQKTLWLGNTQGLIKYSPATNKSERYTYNDGLQSNTFTEASAKSADGTLFFGGINGLNFFKPNEIVEQSYRSTIAFSDFRINNKTIKPGDLYRKSVILDSSINLKSSIHLNYLQNNFMIEFAGFPFDNIQRNKFRYKLEGSDLEWIYVNNKNRIASYTNLGAGEYKFIIQLANCDGSWDKTSKMLAISVSPPFWLTKWAYLIYFVISLLVIIVFLLLLRNHERLKHRIELDRIQLEQEDKVHEFKLMFFTNISHEFKTPLSLIIGPVNDLIRKGAIDETQRFCFNILSRNVNRMLYLVNQLLDFRKITHGRYLIKVVEADLSTFINHITDAFLWEAKQEKISFNIKVPPSFECYFDKDIVEKVISNLLSNAFRATKENGIVEVELINIWKDNNQFANIIIRDSGPGIPDEFKKRIFELFFHGTNRGSSGVGLHLSDQLIKEHHGEICLSDSCFGGAEFSVTIPVSRESYEQNEIYFPQDLDSEEPLNQGIISLSDAENKGEASDHEIVLIVEDNLDLRKYLTSCLSFRYKVFEARNGFEGLIKAEKIQPDLIISDIMMPEMDGIEMLRAIKNNTKLSHIPVIILTAKTDIEYQKIGLEAGAFDYVLKPFDTEMLLSKISNLISFQSSLKKTILSGKVFVDLQKHFTSYDQKLIERLTSIIESNLDNLNFTVDTLAHEIGMSRMQLHRKIKLLTGETTTSYINMIKIRHARNMFDQKCDRVQEAMDAVGINSNSYFNKIFKSFYGETPSNYITLVKNKSAKKE